MSAALEKTIRVFAESKGRTSSEMLCLAVSSSEPRIRLVASREVIARKNASGTLELIKNFGQLAPEQHALLEENREKLASAIRTALLSDAVEAQDNAILAIQRLRPYSLIPQLLYILEQGSFAGNLSVLQWAITFLLEHFTKEFNGVLPRHPLYGHLMVEISEALQRGLSVWRKHQRAIFLETFLRLSDRLITVDDEFQEMMSNLNHPAYPAFSRKLINSSEPYVLRFIMRNLNERLVPSSLLAATAKRTDKAFVRILLESVGYKPSEAFQENLAKIRRFEWLSALRPLLEDLDGGCHRFLVELIRYSGMYDHEKMIVYEQVFKNGKPEGRLAVVHQLRETATTDADRLILLAADDPDDEVQAAALSQLKDRKIRNATSKLMQYVHSPSEKVRKVIINELPEFRMSRFLDKMASLTETQRQQMFLMIKKIDPELKSTMIRALENPDQPEKDTLLDFVAELRDIATFEKTLMQLAERESDFFVRLKAIKLLALGVQPASYACLKRVVETDTNAEMCLLAKRILEIRDTVSKGNAQKGGQHKGTSKSL